MPSDDSSANDGTLGRIALKQVRVARPKPERRKQPAREPSGTRPQPSNAGNPMNRLVPYLDLFSRLGDEELARLAGTPAATVEALRQQVDEVNRGLERYVDLLPRLSDDELVRLTGAAAKTIRFWRLSQPRAAPPSAVPSLVPPSASTSMVGVTPTASSSNTSMATSQVNPPPSASSSGTAIVEPQRRNPPPRESPAQPKPGTREVGFDGLPLNPDAREVEMAVEWDDDEISISDAEEISFEGF